MTSFIPWCRGCGYSGVLWARLKNVKDIEHPHAGVYAFRCKCQRGDDHPRRYPQWNDGLKSTYQVVVESDLTGIGTPETIPPSNLPLAK